MSSFCPLWQFQIEDIISLLFLSHHTYTVICWKRWRSCESKLFTSCPRDFNHITNKCRCGGLVAQSVSTLVTQWIVAHSAFSVHWLSGRNTEWAAMSFLWSSYLGSEPYLLSGLLHHTWVPYPSELVGESQQMWMV